MFNAGLILSTLVAALLHSTAITRHSPGCEPGAGIQLRPEWCRHSEGKVEPPCPAGTHAPSLQPCGRAVAVMEAGKGPFPSCSPQLLSNGMDSLLVVFVLLEFCVAVAVLAFGYHAVKQHSYTAMVRGDRAEPFSQSLWDAASGIPWHQGSFPCPDGLPTPSLRPPKQDSILYPLL